MKKQLLALIIIASSLSACKKEKYTIDKQSLNLKVGERHQFVIKFGDERQKVEHFSWSSSNVEVGNVNGSGQFYAISEGKARVTVVHMNSNGPSFQCEVTVTK